MFDTFYVMLALKMGLIFGLLETIFPFVYYSIRGFSMKKHFMRHPSKWFRFGVAGVKALLLVMPLQLGVNIFLLFPVMLLAYLGLQVIADDYLEFKTV
jgi:hypothetical protein